MSARRIDHLVLAVRDLDRAAAFYEGLGFQVGARNRHPWGTENRLVQFPTAFLELITVGDAAEIPPHRPGVFSFGAFVQDYLAVREGLALLVLDSADAVADAASFARQAIGRFEPFSFERAGRRPDGTATHVAFTLAFARDEGLPDAGFFVCQQHYPEAFWNAQLQQHPNGATGVGAVSLDVADAPAHGDFLRAYTGVEPTADGRRFGLDRGGELRLEVTTDSRRFAGFAVTVPDLEPVAERLRRADVPGRRVGGRVVVAADHAFGAELTFAE